MNTQNNRRYKETEKKICDTLLSLLDKKELAAITVHEICLEAHINRSTFYAHFEDITALIHHLDRCMRKKLMDSFPTTDYKCAYADGSFLSPFLSFVKEHASFYRASLINRTTFPIKDGFDSLMNSVVEPLCKEAGITSQSQILYIMIFYQAGFTMVLKHWVLNGCVEDISELSTYLMHCMHLPFKKET